MRATLERPATQVIVWTAVNVVLAALFWLLLALDDRAAHASGLF